MKGVVFLGDCELALEGFPDRTPGPGEVVLAMKASGMCGSDLHAYRAPKGRRFSIGRAAEGPVIAGHEPCGVVVAVGPGVGEREARIDQRMMCHHYKGCGVCGHCRTGWSQSCEEGIVAYRITGHGGHAENLKVPASTLVPLPDVLSYETAAATACGTSTAYRALPGMTLT